jgi:hypothetical protein
MLVQGPLLQPEAVVGTIVVSDEPVMEALAWHIVVDTLIAFDSDKDAYRKLVDGAELCWICVHAPSSTWRGVRVSFEESNGCATASAAVSTVESVVAAGEDCLLASEEQYFSPCT